MKLTRVGASCHTYPGSLKRCWDEAQAHSDEEAKWHRTKTLGLGLCLPGV